MRAPYENEIALAEHLHPGPDWRGGRVAEGGQFHLVLIAEGRAVLRMARDATQAAEMTRRTALVDALAPELPFALPRSLSGVWRAPDASASAYDAGGLPGWEVPAAVVQEYIPGAAREPHTGDPAALRSILEALADVDVAPIRHLLAPPFAYRGPWTEPKIAATLDALREHAQDEATGAALVVDAARVLAALREFAELRDSLVHGDLAGHNVHWVGGRVAGILDWDLAAAWDPALNVAYLAAWHGRELVGELAVDADEARRARIWDGAMLLETVFNASLRADDPDWAKLMRRAVPRLEAAAAAI
ncbi:aminoglycoside phosphotransferase family protein [Zhihengliuella halotolerans]|uniref:aminoglycoside phosphotransferase family protein n=1 Tax=Zhihengliuella halotolerans TaxID=370736 RepID=UPI000C800711|nr:aminoglycoside phosphotransferase family protein [Zhihengliuella halotolerans]